MDLDSSSTKVQGDSSLGLSLRQEADGGLRLVFEGNLDAAYYKAVLKKAKKLAAKARGKTLYLDLSRVSALDDSGVVLLLEIRRIHGGDGQSCPIIEAPEKIREVLNLMRLEQMCAAPKAPPKKADNLFVRLGQSAFNVAGQFKELVSFTGETLLALFYLSKKPSSLRLDDTILAMRRVGVDAVPIVGLISFLLGFIIAFMSSVQLAQFGANIFVASLVGLAMVRELGPIMTAIIMAGQSGSAFASEIGTMKLNEEVDALSTMGFNPVVFLVLPKMIASVVVMPFLTLFSCLFGVFGGLVVGVFVLDLTFDSYIDQTISILALKDIVWIFIKSTTFGILVTWVGCLRGFQVKGGAGEVGEATTSAVVSSIFLIILWDSIFAFVQLYWK